MGWIDIVERQQKDIASFAELGGDIESADFETVLLLGMGGSSLCPEVLAKTFGPQPGFPALRIVDSTDPAQVKAACDEVNLGETLVIVASKSGSTLEPNILKQFFFDEMRRAVGSEEVGSHFVAITDPGSKMEQVAKDDGFRDIFYGDPQIGGRYSALSNFGVVAATVMGLNVEKLLAEAAKAVASAKQPLQDNPGVQLGLLLGTAANAGRDKITIFTSPEIYDLGAWLEQLIAESTGKQGKGITPVDREAIGAPAVYGNDRIFAYVRLKNTADASQDAKVAALEAAGHPVVHIEIEDLYEIFGQFFTWEVATAVAGSVMGINPFNQPDVESAKIETRALTTRVREDRQAARAQAVPARTGHRPLCHRCLRRQTQGGGAERNAGRDPARASRSASCRRLFRHGGFSAHVPRARSGHSGLPAQGARPQARGYLPGFRPALFALHRTGLQGRPEHGSFLADHRRPRRRRADSGPEIQLRRGHRRSGCGRSGGAGVARTPGPARPPGRRCGRRVTDAAVRRSARLWRSSFQETFCRGPGLLPVTGSGQPRLTV